ncbi:hypothetical protein [Nesterenkonia sp. NBAIMH1]|uniref:hypothetical protein n=1 Tax=Nesterenkonia sp. NBAIMH1 TaxID=2600320 RepID=UPI0011B671BD|nr:hypothetical protein [Nesterenkonia sp. NBAIMH1]
MTPTAARGFERMLAAASDEGAQWRTSRDEKGWRLRSTAALPALEAGDGSVHHLWNAAGSAHHRAGRPWTEAAAHADACGLLMHAAGGGILHGSVSGAQVLYTAEVDTAVLFSTRLRWLTHALDRLTPDWQAWAEILSFGAPVGGHTTFEGMRRLQPMEYAEVSSEGNSPPRRRQARWSWAEHEPRPVKDMQAVTEQVVADMAEFMRPAAAAGASNPMLSGGRDSRMLTALALREAPDAESVTAWTTSSDTGSALEEIVGARAAHALGVGQRIVTGRYDEVDRDLRAYADAVDHQASFHVWLTPVARRLGAAEGPIFDGIGGGVFFGGGFADSSVRSSSESLSAQRAASRSHYLLEANRVLSSALTASLRGSARSRAVEVARPYESHPNGHTLASYLMRTVPGIALAPARVLGRSRPTIMPMISDAVVSAALQLPHEAKAEGAWYPQLLKAADARLAGMPTADDLLGMHHHKRRMASREGARAVAGLIRSGPASLLLSPALRDADPQEGSGLVAWQRALSTTRTQHLLKGLSMLSLWLEDYGPRLTDADPLGVHRA